MSTLICRDPFARWEPHRTRHYVTASTCRYCGNVKQTPKGAKYLYAYDCHTDSGSRSMLSRFFCSVGCMRAFHN